MAELYANSGDPDQMPCCAVSDLDLHCLPITLLRVSLQWVNHTENHPFMLEGLCSFAFGCSAEKLDRFFEVSRRIILIYI